MPRYHFNIYNSISAPDISGTELADINLARCEAIRLAGAVLAEEAEYLRPGEAWTMEVVSSEGVMLFRLDFKLTVFALAGCEPVVN